MTDTTSDPSPDALGVSAYLYAFPLVFNLRQVARYTTTGVGAVSATPFNRVGHAADLATPADTFVTINNDTVYSMAQVDLGVGPVLLTVPATNGRYYVLQLVDAWTNNFAYIGKRATGTEAGTYLLAPPDWSGDVPTGATLVRFPTRVASIVGRWAVTSSDDLAEVHALQAATTLQSLDPAAVPTGLPAVETGHGEALDFWEQYRVWSQAFPPAPRDDELQQSFGPLGLTGDTPVGDLGDEQHAALEAAYAAGKAALDRILHSGSSPHVNGWQLTLHVFDYNLDFFEVGAIDDPAFKIADPRVRIAERAAAALGGLWGNHGYEAAYVMTYVDADGAQLSGDHVYEVTLSPQPPVSGFWSLTMYDVPNFFLVENVAQRYSVGSSTAGVVPDDDGGITITMGREAPTDAKARANWLPTPAGDFRPVLRMYVPSSDVLDGTYEIPAVRRIG